MKNFVIILILLLSAGICYADKISAPPPLPDEPVAEQAYLYEIFKAINKIPIVVVSPNGSLKGIKGEPVLYNNSGSLAISGTFTLWINTDSSTAWQSI